MRLLIGGVGYRNLRDHSFGVVVVDALAELAWPEGASVEDISYNPIAVVQRLEDDPPSRRFERAVIIGAAQRGGRDPGTIAVYRWDNALPGPEHIHQAVTEAVTGVIALDNTLVVARHFGGLPPEVIVIEVEPGAHAFGDELTPEVAVAVDRACEIVEWLVHDPSFAARMPEAPLGGGGLRPKPLLAPTTTDVRARPR